MPAQRFGRGCPADGEPEAPPAPVVPRKESLAGMDPQRLLVSDLDGTLLGDEVALERFRDWFAGQRQSWRLVFATGRTVESVMAIVAAGDLPAPDAIVSNVGADIHDPVGLSLIHISEPTRRTPY